MFLQFNIETTKVIQDQSEYFLKEINNKTEEKHWM